MGVGESCKWCLRSSLQVKQIYLHSVAYNVESHPACLNKAFPRFLRDAYSQQNKRDG